jgi:protein pelota
MLYIGTAALCLMSEHMTTIRQRIDVPVPRKSAGSDTHDKGLHRFYSTLYAAFLRVIPFSTLKVIVIASPGFVKDSVYDYFFAEATKTSNKALLQARKKFVRVHVSSPHVHSLVEVLKSPEVGAPSPPPKSETGTDPWIWPDCISDERNQVRERRHYA